MTNSENAVSITLNNSGRSAKDDSHPELLNIDVPQQAKVAPKITTFSIRLRNIPLFKDLSDEDMKLIKTNFRVKIFNKRDVVLQKGGLGDNLLFLLSGQLQVVDVTEDGRAVGLRILKEGDFFGEIALINGSTRSASVVALSGVLVAFLPASISMQLFTSSPSVAKKMLRHLAEKIQRDSEFRALLSINNTSRRIYAFIDSFKTTAPGNLEVIENLPTHQDIAMMINTSRETVTRALLNLVQQGVVEKDLHRLIIRKPDDLKMLAIKPPT